MSEQEAGSSAWIPDGEAGLFLAIVASVDGGSAGMRVDGTWESRRLPLVEPRENFRKEASPSSDSTAFAWGPALARLREEEELRLAEMSERRSPLGARDGLAFQELRARLAEKHSAADLRRYWRRESGRLVPSLRPPDTSARPSCGVARSEREGRGTDVETGDFPRFEELQARLAEKYSADDIRRYWRREAGRLVVFAATAGA